MDGFEIFCKYMARHHPDLDFSTLDIEAVEKEILVDRPSTIAATSNVNDGWKVPLSLLKLLWIRLPPI